MRNAIFAAWLLLLLAAGQTTAYKVAVVPKMTAAKDFYGLVEQGCMDFSAKTSKDLTCVYRGTLNPSVEGSLQILNELIDDDSIDAISVSVLDPDAYTPVINRGVAQGKPIITFDSDAPDSSRLAYIGTDNFAMGRELAKLLKQIKPDGGTYGIVSGLAHNLILREDGVRDGLRETPWVEVAGSSKDGKEDSHISLEKMWELVEENPSIDAVVSVVGLPMFPQNTTNWKNFVDSNRGVKTIIADTLDVQLQLMQTSYVDALVGQLPYNMGDRSARTLLQVLEELERGTALGEALSSETIFGTHQLEVLRIPLQLPTLDFNYNFIGNAAIVGYVLCGLIMMASMAFMAWTWVYRKNQVVRSGQPVFLLMICVGTLLMGSAIIPLSIDDETSQQAANTACMCSPWLINVGFSIAFSALFSKTWRLNKILLSKHPLRRVKVTEADVIWPLVVLLTLNIITLICWTTIAPLRFVRTKETGTDPWNRSIGSYGQCRSTSGAAGDSVPYLIVIAVVNITALVVANVQAYRARRVRTEFNESQYIAMANGSFLQAIFICIPILALTRENPQAYFIVLSVVLFILSGAILVFIFVPKILALKEQRKNKDKSKRPNVVISGLNEATTDSQQADPVKVLLRQYQALSWEDKVDVKRKLALSPVQPSSSMERATSDETDQTVSHSAEALNDPLAAAATQEQPSATAPADAV